MSTLYLAPSATDQRLAPSSDVAPTPVPKPSQRVVALDILRGIAIIGTLATNIGMWVAASQVEGPRGGWWHHWGTFVTLITDGKYIGLLTIMFGIGLEIQRQAAIRKGEPWLGAYPWRAALLILDGLLNYIFIFQFDVLMGYGLTGLTMCFVFATTERFQKWFLGFGIAVHLAALTFMAQPWNWGQRTSNFNKTDFDLLQLDPSQLSPSQLVKAAKLFGVPPAEYASAWQATALSMDQEQAETYWDVVSGRLHDFWGGRGEIPIMFTMGMGLFLVGAFLYRHGIFEARGAKLRYWVMGLSFGIGLPLDWTTRILYFDHTQPYNRYFTSACVSIGILALVAQFYVKGRTPGRVGTAMSYVGKMALTCYLAQNLIAMILFADYCLNLDQYWSPTWPPLALETAWLLISAMLVTFSWWWLRHFDRGPVELLWHKSYDVVTAHVPTRWEPRVRRADADRGHDSSPVAGYEGSSRPHSFARTADHL